MILTLNFTSNNFNVNISYNRSFVVPDQPLLSSQDRTKLDHDIAAFAISWASEVNELKANFRVKNEGAADTLSDTHYAIVFSYLFDVSMFYPL